MTNRQTDSTLSGKTIVFVSFLEPWSLGKDVGAPSFFETLKGYCEAGANVHYLTHAKTGLGEGDHVTQIETGLPNLTVHRFRIPDFPIIRGFSNIQAKLNRLFLFPLFASKELVHLSSSVGIDVVYAYEQCAILAAWIFSRRRQGKAPPIVNRYQGTILGAKYADRVFAIRKLESWLVLMAPGDAYIMTDDGTLGDQALRHWNSKVDAENLLFIRNGIDKSIRKVAINRAEYLSDRGLDPEHFYLLTVSRLAKWKRVDRAVRIVVALKDRYPTLRLLVCGSGPARADLESLAAQQGVQDRVHFLGPQPRDEVARLIHSADVFLSLYDVSNCGNPLFEAQLAGKPIVTLDNGATGTVIQDRVNGRLIDPEAEPLLPSVVEELIRDTDLRSQLSIGARSWADQELRTWTERIALEIDWLQARIPCLRAESKPPEPLLAQYRSQ